MKVTKRNNRGLEDVKLDKIVSRIRYLCKGLDSSIDPVKIAIETIKNIYDGITTEELDSISAKISESFKLIHPDYASLAGRICVSNLHKSTPSKFSECMSLISNSLTIISEEHMAFITKYATELDNMIIHDNDYNFDYLGFKTLINNYLTKVDDKVIDRPQYMFMRVSIAIYKDFSTDAKECLEQIKICYKALSQMYFIHATPTLFNSCTHRQQLLSCFLLGTGDSIEEIMRTVSNASFISKWAGGIGIHMHCIRCKGSYIKGTNGHSSGLIKQIKIYNEAARCWDQGSKRLGAFAIYLEPWQGDILDFLKLKLNSGAETERARDLFYALWVPDLFIERVNSDDSWSLMSEDTCPYLSDVYDGMDVCDVCHFIKDRSIKQLESGKVVEAIGITCGHNFQKQNVFTKLYTYYENEGKAVRVVKAREILDAICIAQRETGTPYICFKDHVNRKSNQKNIGTIKSSNLCTEIMEFSSKDSYACCTLASINVRKFLIKTTVNNKTVYSIDHVKLHEIARLVARNLDMIIDINYYPVPECKDNNLKYRPMAIGIQGLSDLFCEMKLPYLSDEALKHDIEIMETIYHAALEESVERSKIYGPYSAFKGSPASEGRLQFDLWQEDLDSGNIKLTDMKILSGRYDWTSLKEDIKLHGLRNSLVTGPMPTVSTSQVLGNSESFAIDDLIHVQNTLTGKLVKTNKHLILDLIAKGIWNEDLKNQILNNEGSIQGISNIPIEIRQIYKTPWEISQKEFMTRTAIRGAFVDQSQSLNIHVADSSNATLRAVFLHGHQIGLKTGSYYIRTKPATMTLKNNISISKVRPDSPAKNFCTKDDPNCLSCQ